MTRYADMPESVARHLARLPLPEMEGGAFVSGPPLSERRVAVVSSAGLGRRGDRPFGPGAVDYRVLPADADAETIQTEVYEVGKRHPFESLRDWFRALYEILLGQSQGPRMGSFIALYGLKETVALIDRALAGEDLAA